MDRAGTPIQADSRPSMVDIAGLADDRLRAPRSTLALVPRPPRRKEGVVLRLVCGESLDLLARETVQPAGRIAGWPEEFLAGGRAG